ncbi:mechanosensitive ion channel family protein [Ilumatobacter sp.]|uniref:mechanosensitive ion channel family protein n=1 Tax=Ilumatobacter sp. TaxID=1967498 RepID=UPI003AF98C4A
MRDLVSQPAALVSLAARIAPGQSGDQSSGDESSGDSGNGLVSDVGNEIKVTLDRWSVGQLGLGDLLAAMGVIVGGFVVAWLLRRIIHRGARNMTGAALTAVGTVGKLAGAFVHLLAAALALEILGFSLGPILILILIAVVVLLLLRPMITNLSSGLLLQLRGALDAGDLVRTTRDALGVVQEITTRTTVLDTADGRRIHVPNSDVLNDVIVNYTSLGRLRSTFDITVHHEENLDLVVSTMRLALTQVDGILTEPEPEVQVHDVLGRFIVVRALVWHDPTLEARRSAIDRCIRAVLADLHAAHVTLDGPALADVFADVSSNGDSSSDDTDSK